MINHYNNFFINLSAGLNYIYMYKLRMFISETDFFTF